MVIGGLFQMVKKLRCIGGPMHNAIIEHDMSCTIHEFNKIKMEYNLDYISLEYKNIPYLRFKNLNLDQYIENHFGVDSFPIRGIKND